MKSDNCENWPDLHALPDTFRKQKGIVLIWVLLLMLCMGWNAYSILAAKPYITNHDDNFYFAWARSIVLDGDIDFTNDLALVAGNDQLGKIHYVFDAYLKQTPRTSQGYLPNKYGMGMGLLALPAMYSAKAFIRIFHIFPHYNETQISRIYACIFVLNAIFFGFAGLLISFILLAPRYGTRKALVSVALGTTGLSLGYYIWYQPTMAHGAGFGLMTFYLLVCTHWLRMFLSCSEQVNLRGLLFTSLLMGLVLGVATTLRYTNVVFVAVPFILAISALKSIEKARRVRLISVGLMCLSVAFAGTVAGFFPQLWSWKILYGSWVVYSYQGERLWPWPRYAFEILFGLRNSLFVWTPLAVVAVAGLVTGVVRKERLALGGLFVLLCLVWIYGSWECYWLGNSYGMRGFVEFSFFFFLGLVEILTWIEDRGSSRRFLRRTLKAGIWILVLWNVYFVFCYRSQLQPPEKPFVGTKLLSTPGKPVEQLLLDLGFRLIK